MAKGNTNLEVQHFSAPSGQNQYLVISGGQAATIDVGEAIDDVGRLIADRELTLKYILVTHAHQPRVQALPYLKKKFGAIFCLHEFEYQHLKETDIDTEPDRILNDKDALKLGTSTIRVLLTAGHTKGSVCFWIKEADALFSGSTLLKKSYGQIWGPSSMSLMHFSLKRLGSTIPAKTTIYTGSGELTKMANEGWIHCMRSA